MTAPPTRRALLLALASAPLTGCLGAAEDSSEDTTTDQEMTDTDLLSVEERQQQVDRLPERSSLVGSRVDLVAAGDRSAVAADHGIEYDDTNHTARVAIELEPDAELPDKYRLDTISSYEGRVVATVHIDDLVPLAMDDAVRQIKNPPDSRPTQ